MKIGIVAHQIREEQAQKLYATVGADTMSIDNDIRHWGHRTNHRYIWEDLARITGPDEWAIVLEDDAVPCADFRDQAESALAVCTHDVASFYLGRLNPQHWQDRIGQAVARADREHAHWIMSDIALHAVALAIPGRFIHPMLDATAASRRPIDESISQWVRRFDHRVVYTWPSLVEHADGPSLIDHPDGEPRSSGRVAWRTGTRDHWTARSVNL